MRNILIFLSFLLFISGKYVSAEPFTVMFGLGAAAVSAFGMILEYSGLLQIRCNRGMIECCTHHIGLNIEDFRRDLNQQLHGQHLVIPTVFNAVRGHVTNSNPSKPLVMSFHGWTGGGKNFVSRIIVNNLYKKKQTSSFVHYFNSEIHFKHLDKIGLYKDQLHSWIHHNVSKCGRSIFIFDELDHMPEGLIDVLLPFLGHSTSVDNVDFRKSIFIFLSNTGGDTITKAAMSQWTEGKPREKILLKDLQDTLLLSTYNENSGLRKSKIIRKHLIDHFVPFLPLERRHVRLCAIDEFKRRNITNYSEKDVDDVLDELPWFPRDMNLYSKSGCKKVANKISLFDHTDLIKFS